MNAVNQTTTTTQTQGATVLPARSTVNPTDELVRLLPPTVSVLIPTSYRETTAAEDIALERFIRFLPVSPQLDSTGLAYLNRLVAPFFEGCDVVQVSPQQIKEAWDGHFVKRYNQPISVPTVIDCLQRIFGTSTVLIIGQIEIQHCSTTGRLTLRRNAENYHRLLEFLLLLESEALV